MAAPHSSQTFLQLAGEQGVRQLFSVLKEFPILCESSTDSVPEKKQAWLKVHDVYHRRFQANLIERIPQEKIKKQWSTILANTLATGCSNKWGDDVLVFYHFNAEERKQIDQIRRSRGLDNCQFVCAKTVKEIRDIRKMRQFISMLSSGDDPGQASSSRNKQGNNALEAGANPLPRRAESVAGHARGGVQQVAIHTPPAYPNPVNQQNPHVGASQRTTPQNVTVQQSRSASALSHGQGQRASPYPQMVNRQTVDQTMQPQLQPQVQQQQQRLMNPAQVNQAQVQAAMPQVSVAQNPKLRGHPPTQQLSMPRTTLPEQLQAFQISPGQMMQSIPTGYQPVQQGFMPGYNPQMQQQIANPTQAQIQQQVFSHAQMQRPMNSMQLPQNRNPIEMQQQMNQVQLQQMMVSSAQLQQQVVNQMQIRQARNSSQLQQPVNSAQNYMNQTQLQQQVAQMQRRSPLVQPANPQQMMNSIQMQQMVQAQGQQARNSSQLQQPVNSTQQYMNQVQLQHQVAQMQQSRRSPLMQQPANPAMNPAHVQQAYGQARAQQQATQPGQATSSAYLQHHAVQQLQQQSFPPQTEMSNPGGLQMNQAAFIATSQPSAISPTAGSPCAMPAVARANFTNTTNVNLQSAAPNPATPSSAAMLTSPEINGEERGPISAAQFVAQLQKEQSKKNDDNTRPKPKSNKHQESAMKQLISEDPVQKKIKQEVVEEQELPEATFHVDLAIQNRFEQNWSTGGTVSLVSFDRESLAATVPVEICVMEPEAELGVVEDTCEPEAMEIDLPIVGADKELPEMANAQELEKAAPLVEEGAPEIEELVDAREESAEPRTPMPMNQFLHNYMLRMQELKNKDPMKYFEMEVRVMNLLNNIGAQGEKNRNGLS